LLTFKGNDLRSITINDIKLHTVYLPYLDPIRTSFGVEPNKVAVIVEVITDQGVTGWGEASIEISPGYGTETAVTGLHILENFMAPAVIGKTIDDPRQFPALIRQYRGNHHTRAGIESAVWDAFAKTNEMRLTDCFASYLPDGHASEGFATVGISIGIQPTLGATVKAIQTRVDQGYQRIKLKIARGWDVEVAKAVREAFPDIMLMLDANSDYSLEDADHLKKLDDYDLLMMEQPLAHDDIYEHSKLQKQLNTRICLDESVKSASDLQVALALGSCKILNLKPARVGGFTECLAIYEICVAHDLPLWIGGMLETGIGRAANISFASLPAVNLPSDISATNRYFDPDITSPDFVLGENSTLAVADGIGIGVEVNREQLEVAKERWNAEYPYIKTRIST
jgi:o-succinylbenzoate synthase